MEVKRKNNRRFLRHRVPLCAWLEFRDDDSTRAMRSLDLSTEGARFATIRAVEKNDPIMVRLEVRPGAPAVECKGRVCWVEPMQDRVRLFGIRFVDLAEDERIQIEQALVESTSRQSMAAI
jgi:Tfp pilus assembly protein PilZ